jgi:hypothetical protein
MDDKDRVVKHLEITQGVINRLANNSFLIKGWSMAIIGAAILFIARIGTQSECLVLAFSVPVIAFWILDGYFLWQERLFRGIFNDVRLHDKTDFEMNVAAQLNKPKHKWRDAIFSSTLNIFYLAELTFIFVAFLTLKFG